MKEKEFEARWKEEKLTYKAWGTFVRDEIVKGCVAQEAGTDELFKIQPEPRVKQLKSLIDKAFFRGKGYKDPYEEITDKVGVRFVVLFVENIAVVKEVIEGSERWEWTLDRDFEEERKQKPLEFVYQSVHYIVRAAEEMSFEEVEIPEGIPCEVQVRTLLQHAWGELAHDTTYKPRTRPSTKADRTVAKSMALIEATDEFFSQVITHLKEASETERSVLRALQAAYKEFVGESAELQESDRYVVGALNGLIEQGFEDALKAFLGDHRGVVEAVRSKRDEKPLYQRAVILLLFFLASKKPAELGSQNPLMREDLEPVYTELGKSPDKYL